LGISLTANPCLVALAEDRVRIERTLTGLNLAYELYRQARIARLEAQDRAHGLPAPDGFSDLREAFAGEMRALAGYRGELEKRRGEWTAGEGATESPTAR